MIKQLSQTRKIQKIQQTLLLATLIGILPAEASEMSMNNCSQPAQSYAASMPSCMPSMPTANCNPAMMNSASCPMPGATTGSSSNYNHTGSSDTWSQSHSDYNFNGLMPSGKSMESGVSRVIPIVPVVNIQTNALAPAVEAVNGNIQINQGQQNLTLFSSTNQVLQGAKGQVIGGAPGTMIERDKNYIILHRGRLTMQSGQQPSVVLTRMGEVKINAETIAIIDDQNEKSIHVIAVAGKDDALTVTGPVCQGNTLSARSGEELILSSKGIEEEELIPAEGTEIIVTGAIEKRPTVARAKASFIQMHIEGPSQARAGKFAQLSGTGKMLSNSQKSFSGNIWDLLDPKSASPMQIVAEAGSQIQERDGTLKLLSGTIFVQAKSDISIETPFLKVEAKRNALVMLQSESTISRIKAFSGPEDVLVKFGKSKLELAPGQEVVVSSHSLSKDEINPADFVARRARIASQASDSLHHALNDFSISSMLHYAGYRNMIAKSELSGKMTDKVLKTAVVVEMVTKGRGQYAYSSLYEPQQQQQVVNAEAHKISSAQIK